MSISEKANDDIIIDILGDLCLAWYTLDKSEFTKVADKINGTLGKVDYRIANLEAPILCREDDLPSLKEGEAVNLGVNKNYIDFLGKLDIHAYTLANNHLGDYGKEGIEDTITTLEALKKQYVGTSLVYENTYVPLRVEVEGIKISILSICENEFGIATCGKIGAAGFNSSIVKSTLREESSWSDLKIVIYHGGIEFYPFPTPGLKERYHWLVDMGADAVIGMHTHCPVGFEQYGSGLIIYSLGNFFFPRNSAIIYENWNIGYVARLHIKKNEKINFEPIPYTFSNDGRVFESIENDSFNNYYNEISAIILNDNELGNMFKGWVSYSGKRHFETLKYCIGCDSSVYAFNVIKNFFTCEAHNELLTAYMNMQYYEPDVDYRDYFNRIKKYINCSSIFLCNSDREHDDLCFSPNYVLWGVSAKAEKVYMELKIKKGEALLVDKDPDKQGLYFLGMLIEAPEIVVTNNKNAKYIICTAEKHFGEIKSYLLKAGVAEANIWKENGSAVYCK